MPESRPPRRTIFPDLKAPSQFVHLLFVHLLFVLFVFVHVLIVHVLIGTQTHSSHLYAQYIDAEPFENGVVSSADVRASQAGIEIMQKGGNAIDAAVAVQFALAVTTPRAGNLGGGGFLVYRSADGDVFSLDFREKAPANATETMFLNKQGEVISEASKVGGLASGVPGSVDGMISALERYGSLPLEIVMEPAIRLASEGFLLHHVQAADLNDHASLFKKFDGSSNIFLRDDGRPWKAGDRFVQQDLAQTLRRIASMGRDGFYAGSTAAAIVREMRRQGGIITLGDLRDYESVWREPVTVSFDDYTLHLMPPPSSGGLVIQQILAMIQHMAGADSSSINPNQLAVADSLSINRNQHAAADSSSINPNQKTGTGLGYLGFNDAKTVHMLSEAMRRAFADRNFYLGDPDFTEIPSGLTADGYLRGRAASFRPNRATPSDSIAHGDPAAFLESGETTHFSVIDRDGAAVAVTTTLNGSFGSGVTISGAGFLMNNEMDDFSAKPGVPNMFGLVGADANAVAPGKRMLSSMTPVVVTSGDRVVMATGAAGGPRIITAVLQQFLNIALFDMNPVQSVFAPRVHHQWLPDVLYAEPFALSPDTRRLLESFGHRVEIRETVGRVHSVFSDEHGVRFGVADPRGEGAVAGF